MRHQKRLSSRIVGRHELDDLLRIGEGDPYLLSRLQFDRLEAAVPEEPEGKLFNDDSRFRDRLGVKLSKACSGFIMVRMQRCGHRLFLIFRLVISGSWMS